MVNRRCQVVAPSARRPALGESHLQQHDGRIVLSRVICINSYWSWEEDWHKSATLSTAEKKWNYIFFFDGCACQTETKRRQRPRLQFRETVQVHEASLHLNTKSQHTSYLHELSVQRLLIYVFLAGAPFHSFNVALLTPAVVIKM